jgi:hypothetical protein
MRWPGEAGRAGEGVTWGNGILCFCLVLCSIWIDALGGQMLRRLPIFETKGGAFVALSEARDGGVILCPPGFEPEVRAEGLLEHREPELYAALGVEVVDETAVFERFVLPSLHTQSFARRVHAVQHVRDHWAEVRARPALLERLRAAELVPIAGVFVRADQLLDPRVPLLARVFRSDPVFPTGEFGSEAWLAILRVLGLQSAITGDLFLQCARRVQRSFAQAVAEGSTPCKPFAHLCL